MTTMVQQVLETLHLTTTPAAEQASGQSVDQSKLNRQNHDLTAKVVSPPAQAPDIDLSLLSLPEKVFLLSGSSFTTTGEATKLSLYKAKCSDALSDVRGSTVFNGPAAAIFPNSTALAATWNVELLQQIGVELAEEMALKNVDVLMAPNLNLHRDPRAGRNQETFGEDPILAGHCGAAIVKGVHSAGKNVTIKHFVCNDSETSRRTYDVQVDERTLREIYLRPFEIVLKEASPSSIMTAYNSVNGCSASASKELLLNILRQEWQYDGLVMSDWFGTYDGLDSLHASMDLEMPFPATRGKRLLEAVADGKISEELLDTSVKRVLRFLKRCNAGEKQLPELPTDNDPARCALLRKVSAESIILLQNHENKLPLQHKLIKSVAVIGALATAKPFTHLCNPSYLVSPLQGIQDVLRNTNVEVMHAPGPDVHVLIPLLDKRFCEEVIFNMWNVDQPRSKRLRPVATENYPSARIALLMRHIPSLDQDYEIEMKAAVKVPKSGRYRIGIVSGSDAEFYIDGHKAYTFLPDGLVDVQRFLFHQHEFEQTFEHDFEAGRVYNFLCYSRSQKQTGPEPVATGLFVGMVETSTKDQRIQEAVEIAKVADEVILCVGTTAEHEMEGVDRKDLKLPPGTDDLLQAISAVRNGDLIVVNQSGAAVDLHAAVSAKSVLHAHFGGQEVGNAIADVIFGRVNPSGKSTFTWPARLEDCPSYGNFPHDDNLKIRYCEGIYMGWKGFDREGAPRPLFAFGHGLSYTDFAYTDLSIRETGESTARINLTVRNTGRVSGKQTLQVFVSGPTGSSKARPDKTMQAFVKTGLLAPDGTEEITVLLDRRAFAHWDVLKHSWEVESGQHSIAIGVSSIDIVASGSIDF